jgi:malate dehydrogenase (oxaloacetate-decarboxylating)(NADP+)
MDPRCNAHLESFEKELYLLRQRKGWNFSETQRKLQNRYVFGAMLVRSGLVDGQVHGIAQSYPNAIRPVLQVIPRREGVNKVSGLYLMISKNHTMLFADTTVNIDPGPEDLAEIALLSAEMALFFDMPPRVAMLSFSNFGSVAHPESNKMVAALEIARRRRPDLVIDGEMQADMAVVDELLQESFPFNRLGRGANVLVFPSLAAGNIAYKLLDRLGGAKAVGPLLMGLSKPFNVLQRNTDMENVVNVLAITVAQAQNQKEKRGVEF